MRLIFQAQLTENGKTGFLSIRWQLGLDKENPQNLLWIFLFSNLFLCHPLDYTIVAGISPLRIEMTGSAIIY